MRKHTNREKRRAEKNNNEITLRAMHSVESYISIVLRIKYSNFNSSNKTTQQTEGVDTKYTCRNKIQRIFMNSLIDPLHQPHFVAKIIHNDWVFSILIGIDSLNVYA